MSDPRFYCPTPILADQTMPLPTELAHHAIRVLRLKSGAAISLFDGLGGQYDATLLIEGKKGLAQIGQRQDINRELPGRLALVQGIASGDKMDWIIEKSVELGAYRLVPITAQRSVLQLKGLRLEKRLDHWMRVAQAASEQCGRNRLMQIDPPCALGDYLAKHNASAQNKSDAAKRGAANGSMSASDLSVQEQILCCHPDADTTLSQALRPGLTPISLLVGPEGGWSDEELALVRTSSLTTIRFGTRTLRTETAGLALLAAVCALKGWV